MRLFHHDEIQPPSDYPGMISAFGNPANYFRLVHILPELRAAHTYYCNIDYAYLYGYRYNCPVKIIRRQSPIHENMKIMLT